MIIKQDPRMLKMKKFWDTVNQLSPTLMERYKDCNDNGHSNPNEEINRCDYCYRRLEKRPLEFEEGVIPVGMVLHGGIGNMDNVNEVYNEPTLQIMEYFAGIDLLEKELDSSGELEGKLGGQNA